MPTVSIDAFLAGEGFASADSRARARRILEDAGLTNPRKRGMDDSKLPRARAVLQERAVRCCERCLPLKQCNGDVLLVDSSRSCSVCEGSDNHYAALALVHAMRANGVSKLLVVGGTPANHRDLTARLTALGITLRCIDGAGRPPTQKEAWAHLAWADLTVIWASTPLPHKVSELYTAERIGRPPITVARRGVTALCREVRLSLERHGAGAS